MRDSQVTVLWMSGKSYIPGQAVARHAHHFLQAQFIIAGQEHLMLDQQSEVLTPGTWVLIPPDMPHSYTFTEPSRMIDWKFTVSADFLAQLQPLLHYPTIDVGDPAITTNINYLLQLISHTDLRLDPDKLLLIDSQTKTILLQLLQLVSTHRLPTIPATITEGQQFPPQLAEMIRYIEANIGGDLSLTALTKEFPYSKSYLNTLFKQTVAVTPNQFIQEYRITYAKQLLMYTNQSIDAIANTVGFNNNYFTKRFTAIEGQTPSQFRRQYRQHQTQNIILSDDFDITTQP